ncbi:hypothetical protein D3C81_1760080 [compost metagenome]
MLADDGQIANKSQPSTILDALVSHHLLIRAGETLGYSFQYQKFQEWHASHAVERHIISEVTDHDGRELLKAEIINFRSGRSGKLLRPYLILIVFRCF